MTMTTRRCEKMFEGLPSLQVSSFPFLRRGFFFDDNKVTKTMEVVTPTGVSKVILPCSNNFEAANWKEPMD